MLREFFCAEEGWQRVWAWVGLIIFIGHQAFRAFVSWRLNGWYESFYDMLQTSMVDVVQFSSGEDSGGTGTAWEVAQQRIAVQLLDFVYIVSPSVLIHPLAGVLRNWWVFQWRVALMTIYLKRYNMQLPALEGTSQRSSHDKRIY